MAGQRVLIFLLSCVVKGAVGYAFFGSVDLVTSVNISASILAGDGRMMDQLPYFPTIPAFIWFGGILNAMTPLPLAFCYKVFPILFDSLLAVLIVDFAAARGAPRPWALGLLYALCPVAIVVNGLHGQWDSIFLYFLVLAIFARDCMADSPAKCVLFGLFFCASLLIKPVAAIFLPFLVIPMAGDGGISFAKGNALSLSVMAGILAGALAVFHLSGFVVESLFATIASYAKSGTTILGLPHAFPFSRFEALMGRQWIIVLSAVVAFAYYAGRIDFAEAALFVFMMVMAAAAVAPQYLLWPLPLLLATGRPGPAAVYGLAASVFLAVYYMQPEASFLAWENMATFAALKPLAWAMPPAWLTEARMLPLARFLGNYAIPLISLATAVVLARAYQRPERRRADPRNISPVTHIAASAAIAVGLAGTFLATRLGGLDVVMDAIVPAKIAAYAMVERPLPDYPFGGGTCCYLGTYGTPSPVNAFTAGIALAAGWSLAAAFLARRKETNP
jgi:hypothetical protein